VKGEPFVMRLNGITPRLAYKLREIRAMLDLQRPTSESAPPHAAVDPSAFDAASADGARLGAAQSGRAEMALCSAYSATGLGVAVPRLAIRSTKTPSASACRKNGPERASDRSRIE
jgi:hypothetical protein